MVDTLIQSARRSLQEVDGTKKRHHVGKVQQAGKVIVPDFAERFFNRLEDLPAAMPCLAIVNPRRKRPMNRKILGSFDEREIKYACILGSAWQTEMYAGS